MKIDSMIHLTILIIYLKLFYRTVSCIRNHHRIHVVVMTLQVI
jgi:hypothetical protein